MTARIKSFLEIFTENLLTLPLAIALTLTLPLAIALAIVLALALPLALAIALTLTLPLAIVLIISLIEYEGQHQEVQEMKPRKKFLRFVGISILIGVIIATGYGFFTGGYEHRIPVDWSGSTHVSISPPQNWTCLEWGNETKEIVAVKVNTTILEFVKYLDTSIHINVDYAGIGNYWKENNITPTNGYKITVIEYVNTTEQVCLREGLDCREEVVKTRNYNNGEYRTAYEVDFSPIKFPLVVHGGAKMNFIVPINPEKEVAMFPEITTDQDNFLMRYVEDEGLVYIQNFPNEPDVVIRNLTVYVEPLIETKRTVCSQERVA